MAQLLKYFKGDKYIWLIILSLASISVLAVYSASGTLAYEHFKDNTSHYLMRHSVLLFLGLATVFLVQNYHYEKWYKYFSYSLYIAWILLVITIFRGTALNQASRWLTIPVLGIPFQPSDLAKFTLILYISSYLADKQDVIRDFKKGLLPVLMHILITCGLIFISDFSTSAMLGMISIILLYMGRMRTSHLMYMILTGVIALLFLFLLREPLSHLGRIGTVGKRIERFISSEKDTDASEQSDVALIAIVKGGFTGKGPGRSEQRNFLPEAYSDFIFAIIVEEYGVGGALFVIFLYIALFFRIGQIVANTTSRFGAFFALGIGLSFFIQAFINMGVAVGLLPVTGQTLPFISMGGTSLVISGVALGIILNISQQTKRNIK